MSAALEERADEEASIDEVTAKVDLGPAEVSAPGIGELLLKVRARLRAQSLRICSHTHHTEVITSH